MNYSDLLSDPLWLKKSKEIKTKNNHKCEECGKTEIELNVHHCWYQVNKLPWEYPDECFKCLCRACHLKREVAEITAKQFLALMDYSELKIVLQVLLNYAKGGK